MMTSYPACNKTSLSRKPCIPDKKLLLITIMKSWLLSNFYKKQQILIKKSYQFINVVNGLRHSHKTAPLTTLLLDFTSIPKLICMFIKAIYI